MNKTYLKFIGSPFEILIGAGILYYNSGKGGFLNILGYLIIAIGLISLVLKLYFTFAKKAKNHS